LTAILLLLALASPPKRTWALLTDPRTPYLLRMEEARAAVRTMPLDQLPRIRAAMVETQGNWGWRDPDRPMIVPRRPVVVLGHLYRYPARLGEYPRTPAEEMSAPWPWQAHKAFENLWYGIVRTRDAGELYEYARGLPCGTRDEVEYFTRVSANVAEQRLALVPDDIIGAWRNLLRRRAITAQEISFSGGLNLVDRDSWLAAHILLLEAAKQDMIYSAAFHMGKLVRRGGYGTLPSPLPQTLLLEIGRRATTNPKIAKYERATAGLWSAGLMGDKIAPYEDTLLPEKVDSVIARFTEWFAAHEKELERGAAAESFELEKASDRYVSRQCR
jgi:hypothetical protein